MSACAVNAHSSPAMTRTQSYFIPTGWARSTARPQRPYAVRHSVPSIIFVMELSHRQRIEVKVLQTEQNGDESRSYKVGRHAGV